MVIAVAHDFTCPWCWIGLSQASRLQAEHGVSFDWLGFELFPEELAWPEPGPPEPRDERRPATPSRLELAYAAEGIERPTAQRPRRMRVHNALEAVEHAKTVGRQDEVVEALYRAYWERGEAIGELAVLRSVLEGIVPDLDAMAADVEGRRFASKIVPFDDQAYAAGVFNVPTFFIGGERYAEQPYRVLSAAVEACKAQA
jgi:predicted DsbA family dithiol-disulfide isomerase